MQNHESSVYNVRKKRDSVSTRLKQYMMQTITECPQVYETKAHIFGKNILLNCLMNFGAFEMWDSVIMAHNELNWCEDRCIAPDDYGSTWKHFALNLMLIQSSFLISVSCLFSLVCVWKMWCGQSKQPRTAHLAVYALQRTQRGQ